MTQPFKLRYQNEIVGAFVVVFVLVGGLLAFVVSGGREAPLGGFAVELVVRRVGGVILPPGTPVRLHSRQIGAVTRAGVDERGDLRATLGLGRAAKDVINADAQAILHLPTASLTGETYVDLLPGVSTRPLRRGEAIEGRIARDTLELASDMLLVLERDLAPTLTAVRQAALQHEATFSKIDRLLEHEARFVSLMDQAEGLLGEAEGALGGARRLVERVERGEGLVGRAFAEGELDADLRRVVGRLEDAMERLDRVLATMTRAAEPMPELVSESRDALRDVARVAAELRRLAPALPPMVQQLDELLGEGRAVVDTFERHWLVGGMMRAEDAPLPSSSAGLRDTPREPELEQLRQRLAPQTPSRADAP